MLLAFMSLVLRKASVKVFAGGMSALIILFVWAEQELICFELSSSQRRNSACCVTSSINVKLTYRENWWGYQGRPQWSRSHHSENRSRYSWHFWGFNNTSAGQLSHAHVLLMNDHLRTVSHLDIWLWNRCFDSQLFAPGQFPGLWMVLQMTFWSSPLVWSTLRHSRSLLPFKKLAQASSEHWHTF